jgi:hypothetical protein
MDRVAPERTFTSPPWYLTRLLATITFMKMKFPFLGTDPVPAQSEGAGRRPECFQAHHFIHPMAFFRTGRVDGLGNE